MKKHPKTPKGTADQNMAFDELFPHPHLRGYRLIAPAHDRRHEQEFSNNRNALCRDKDFRRDIMTLRHRYPPQYWEVHKTWEQRAVKLQGKANERCRSVSKLWDWKDGIAPSVDKLSFTPPRITPSVTIDIDLLCSSWGLHHPQDKRWAHWLIRHWDPAQDDLPPTEPQSVRPWLDRWFLRIDNVRLQGKSSDIPFHATLTLLRGVSGHEAKAAAELAVQSLKAPPSLGGRARLSDRERHAILSIFETLGLPKKRGRDAYAHKVQAIMREKGYPLSLSTISPLLRKWIIEKGGSVKRYFRD